MRERSWNEIATNGTYHPVLSGNQWILSTGPETLSGFTRSITIGSVYRDSNGAIVASGGSLDPSTKQVTVVVSWVNPFASQTTATLYFTRFVNQTWVETTETDFTAGTKTDVVVTNNAGGEVTLGAGGHGDWCRPGDFVVDELDLPQTGAARDIKAIEGKAFTGTNAGGGSFVEIAITNDDLPQASISSTFAGYQTNDVFIDSNYAYIATNDVSKDVVIIDLTTNQEVGYFNDTNPFGRAQGIWVSGNIGYATIGFNLHTFDLSSKTGSRPELDNLFLWGTAYRLQVVGNYAYVAVDWGISELRLVNVLNPQDLRLGARADVNGSRGQEVFVNDTGTRAYLATSHSGSKPEFFIINTDYDSASKSNPFFNLAVISSYDSSGMDPKGVTVVPGNKALLAGSGGGEEYQVLDISNESSPTRCGGLDIGSGIYGITAILEQDGDAYSYIVTGDGNGEFKIIEGGPGGRYAASGIYESVTFEATTSAAFNRFTTSVVTPAQTDINFQFAASDPVDGSCTGATFIFVGPDGTEATRFATTSAVLPLSDDGIGYENPARCFRYKVYLSTTDPSQSPVLNDITVNYSL